LARAPKKGSASKPARKPTPKAAKPSPKKPAPKKPAARATPATPSKAAAREPAPKPAKTVAKAAKTAPKPPARPAPKPAPAKAPAKAPPPPPKPAKPRKPEVTPKQIEKIKDGLVTQRAQLIREATDLEEGAFNTSQSEMSGEASFDEEYADAGSFTFEREKELSISNNIRDLLSKVDHALDRIDRGTYGLCENCGDPINRERLLALPYSTLCLRCKQAEERAR
jgi:RNA polymerase-binding protein DksA